MSSSFSNVLRVTRKFGFIMAAIMILPYLLSFPAVMGYEGPTVKEAHELSLDELQKQYDLIDAREREIDYLAESLNHEFNQDWLTVDSEGILHLSIPDEDALQVDDKLLNDLEKIVSTRNQLIEEGIAALDENGDLYLLNIDDMFNIQASSIRLVGQYRKVLGVKLPIGWDLVANDYKAATVLAILGIAADALNLFMDISQIWKNNDLIATIALGYSRSLHEVIRQLGQFFLSGIPAYMLTGIELAWNAIVIGGGSAFRTILGIIRLMLPPMSHSMAILNHVKNRRLGATFEYTLIAYSGYKLHYR